MHKKGGAREGSSDAKAHKLVCIVTIILYFYPFCTLKGFPCKTPPLTVTLQN